MAKFKNKPTKLLTFKGAVETTPEISAAVKPGLGALKGDESRKITVADKRLLNGSVDIDLALERIYPNANRWDYAIGYDGKAYFVEFHSAESSEVSVVLKKLAWLKQWLNDKAPNLKALKTPQGGYYWVQSGRFNIPKMSAQYRIAVSKGLLPINKLTLPPT